MSQSLSSYGSYILVEQVRNYKDKQISIQIYGMHNKQTENQKGN